MIQPKIIKRISAYLVIRLCDKRFKSLCTKTRSIKNE